MNAVPHEQMERLEVTRASRRTDGIYLEHYFRYVFARKYVSGRTVLDCACGTGYGTSLLAANAGEVVGVDNSPDALAIAGSQWRDPKTHYLLLDIRDLGSLRRTFDVIVSFETIEHLAHPADFLAAAQALLNPDGVFIVSTPNRAAYCQETELNPFHLNEFNSAEFEHTLVKSFINIEQYRQLSVPRELRLQRRGSRWYSGIKAPLIDAVIGNRLVYDAYLLRMKRRFSVVPVRDKVQYRYLVAVCRKR